MDDITRRRLMLTLEELAGETVADFELAFQLLKLNVAVTDPELGEAFQRAWVGVAARANGRIH